MKELDAVKKHLLIAIQCVPYRAQPGMFLILSWLLEGELKMCYVAGHIFFLHISMTGAVSRTVCLVVCF